MMHGTINIRFEEQVQSNLQPKTQFPPLAEHAVSVAETRRLTVFKETVAVGCTIHK